MNTGDIFLVLVSIHPHHQGFEPTGIGGSSLCVANTLPWDFRISWFKKQQTTGQSYDHEMHVISPQNVRIWTPLWSSPSYFVIKPKLHGQLQQISFFKPLTAFTFHACNLQQIDQGLLFILMPECIIFILVIICSVTTENVWLPKKKRELCQKSKFFLKMQTFLIALMEDMHWNPRAQSGTKILHLNWNFSPCLFHNLLLSIFPSQQLKFGALLHLRGNCKAAGK